MTDDLASLFQPLGFLAKLVGGLRPSPTPQSPPLPMQEEEAVVTEHAPAAMEVAQTLKQAVSLATRPRSLPSQEAEAEEVTRTLLVLRSLVTRALPPYRAAALARQFLAVRQPAALSPYLVLRLVVAAAPEVQP